MKSTTVVVHPGALGDVLLSLSAIRHIKSSYPTHYLILVCRSDVGDLLRTCGEIDETISIERNSGRSAGRGRVQLCCTGTTARQQLSNV